MPWVDKNSEQGRSAIAKFTIILERATDEEVEFEAIRELEDVLRRLYSVEAAVHDQRPATP